MDFSKRVNTNRRLTNGNYSEKLYSKVWIIALRIVCVVFLAGCFGAAGTLLGTFMGLLDGAPEVTLESLAFNRETSKIVDLEGNLITEIKSAETRYSIPIDQMPQSLRDAVVAIEDHRFYEHNGIDIEGILRAGVSNFLSGDSTGQGGSTITQQMIKKLVLTSDQTWKRKIQEWYLALQLEEKMNEVYGKQGTKNLILESYLNYNFLGNNCYGVQAAAQRYFGKDAKDLRLSESALIAGLFNAPSAYDPIINYEGHSRERQLLVLDSMLQYGFITQDQYESACREDVFAVIKAKNQQRINNQTDDVYSYFVETVLDKVQKDLESDLGYSSRDAFNLIYYGGITIYITQDQRIQGILDDVFLDESFFQADSYYEMDYYLTIFDEKDPNITDNYGTYALFPSEEACYIAAEEFKSHYVTEDMVEGVHYVESMNIVIQPQYAMTIIDQSTGYVVGIAGGRGPKTGNFGTNRAVYSTRQPGSTFKILGSYTGALDAGGFGCGSSMDDAPLNWNGWQPHNWWGNSYFGAQTMRRGIAYSENIVTARFMRAVGVETNFDYVESYGFSNLRREPDEWGNSDMVGSLCLGSAAVYNYELCAAYATIANKGVYIEPQFYTKILDSNGNLFFTNEPETHRVIKETTAWMLTDMMRDCLTGANGGTGTACNFDWSMYIAGKTGTSNDDNDYAFVGFTPYYTAAIQCGFDYTSYPQEYYESLGYYSVDPDGRGLLSYTAHKVIWSTVMARVHEPLESIGYIDQPEGLVQVATCIDSGKLPNACCSRDPRGSRITYDWFAADSIPYETCDRHVELTICSDTKMIATEYCEHTEKGVFLTRSEEDIEDIGINNLELLDDFKYCAYPTKIVGNNFTVTPPKGVKEPKTPIREGYKAKYVGECIVHSHEEESSEDTSSEIIESSPEEESPPNQDSSPNDEESSSTESSED